MNAIVTGGIYDSFVNEEFNTVKQDFISSLSDELFLEVFSHLKLATLGTICCVSKQWKRLATEPIQLKIAIYREIAFGNNKWAQCFGKRIIDEEDSQEEFSSLPVNDFIEDCKKFQRIFPEKNARDSLMLVRLPKTLNGQLNLKSLGELAKKWLSPCDTGYHFLWPPIVDELGDRSIDKSYWVLMTKDVVPGSRNKSYAEQQDIVGELAQKALIGYEIPGTLEAAVCIFAQFFDLNIRLFDNDPSTYTRCKDKVNDWQTVVGCYNPMGLCVGCFRHDSVEVGVAALRRF